MKTSKPLLIITGLLFFALFAYSQKAEKFIKMGGYQGGCEDIMTDAANSLIAVSWSKVSTTIVSYEYGIGKSDSAGNFVTAFPAGGTMDGDLWPFAPVKVKTDAQNNVYISVVDGGPWGMDAIPYLRKYDPNGGFVWEVVTSSAATDIAVDDSFNVYVTSNRSHFIFHGASPTVLTPLATQKISPAGIILWTDTVHYAEHIASINDKIVLTSPTICLSANDSLLWTSPIGGTGISTFHDKIYLSQGGTFACLNDSGILQWSVPTNGTSKHVTNNSGYSALIKSNLLLVVDSTGNTVWQHVNVRGLSDVAIKSNGNVYVQGGNNNCSDWFMGPIYVPYYPMAAGSTCTDPWAYYQYLAEYSYDSLNSSFIHVHMHYDYDDINDFTGPNSPVYYCAGDRLAKEYDCDWFNSYDLIYVTSGQFGAGNQFIKLIDDDSTFGSPDTVYNNIIPLNATAGLNYYKVVSTNPVAESNIYSINIQPNPPPVITTAGIFTCPGDTLLLTINYPYPNCYFMTWYRNNTYFEWGYLTIPVTETGSYTVAYEDYEGSGCDIKPPSQPVKVRVAFSCFTNIHHTAFLDADRKGNNSSAITMYPNPFAGNTTVFTNDNGNLEIAVYSTDGRLIKSMACNNCNSISVGEDLAPGIYYLHYTVENEKGVMGFVKL